MKSRIWTPIAALCDISRVLQHVAVEVAPEHVNACVAFYGLLGFAPVPAPASLQGRATWVQSGATQVHLMPVQDPVAPPRGHLAVVAREYAATLAALRAAGHEVQARREHWGSPRSYVRDPAGTLVEVMAAPPG